MFVILTVALLGIFYSDPGTSKATELATTKVTMANLLDPQVLFVAGTSRDSPEMKRLTELFKQNVERDHGKFIELENANLNDGKTKNNFGKTKSGEFCFLFAVLLNISRTDKLRYNENLVAAFKVSVTGPNYLVIEAFYTRNIIHSVAIAMNLAMNVKLQFLNRDSHTILVTNAPLSR
jgi:hypothetical protein